MEALANGGDAGTVLGDGGVREWILGERCRPRHEIDGIARHAGCDAGGGLRRLEGGAFIGQIGLLRL